MFDANRFLHRQFLMRTVFYLFKLVCMSCRSNEFHDILKLFFNFISSILSMNCIKSNSLSTIRFDIKRNAQKVLCIASPATTHRSEYSVLTFRKFSVASTFRLELLTQFSTDECDCTKLLMTFRYHSALRTAIWHSSSCYFFPNEWLKITAIKCARKVERVKLRHATIKSPDQNE